MGLMMHNKPYGGSRKFGMFADPDPNVTVLRMNSPEYLAAFEACDPNKTGFIDLKFLGEALHAVQLAAEVGGSCQNISMRPFHSATCCLLCTRFGDGSRLSAIQFCEMLYYLHNLKMIFMHLDVDHSGGIEGAELQRGLQCSGADMGSEVVAQILRSYDEDQSQALEFDEFVHLRLEWDHYISAWDRCTHGAPTIEPGQLLMVLEEIKRTTAPVRSAMVAQGLSPPGAFQMRRPFQTRTCERLIMRFGRDSCFLSFEQFCNMMVSLREMKEVFRALDARGNGTLGFADLSTAMRRLGMDLPPHLLAKVCRPFAMNESGEIEFDEFVQMMVEWNEVWRERWRFGENAAGRIGPVQLQELFGHVRVIYRAISGVAQVTRRFNFNTCRWLVAKFGACQGGEAFAQSLTWVEFLHLVVYLKDAHDKFLQINLLQTGALSTEELGAAMDVYGIHLGPEAIDNIRRSYDIDGSGTFEFDEFLQLLLECQLYEQCFDAKAAHPTTLTPLSTLHTSPGPQPPAANGPGVVTLDKSAFFSLVFAVPRHVGRERLAT